MWRKKRWVWRIMLAGLAIAIAGPLVASRYGTFSYTTHRALLLPIVMSLSQGKLIFTECRCPRESPPKTVPVATPPTSRMIVHGTPADLKFVQLLVLNLDYESAKHPPGFWIERKTFGSISGVAVEWWLITIPALLLGLWPLGRAIYQYAKSRRDRGIRHCPTCNYNLTGLPSTRCPECGKQFSVL